MWEKNQKIVKNIVVRKQLIVGWLALYLLLDLMRFIRLFARCFYFYFMESLTIGFAISKAKFKNTDIINSFSR